MNESDYNRLREESWRRALSPAEEADLKAWLAAHPESSVEWESDLALTKTLDQLPSAPVPSNFTARLVQQIEREAAAEMRRKGSKWHWLRLLLPKTAVAAVILTVGVLAVHEHRVVKRQQLAQSIAAVSEVSSLPGPEILQDFDAIQQISRQPAGDKVLLAALTQ